MFRYRVFAIVGDITNRDVPLLCRIQIDMIESRAAGGNKFQGGEVVQYLFSQF